MQYKTFRETLQDIIEGKKADLVAAIKNRESKVKDPDNDIRLAGMRTRLSKMPDDVAKAVRGDTDTPIKKSMRANRPKGAESDEAFQARLAANTKKLPPEEEKDNRSDREIEADKNAKRRATLTAAEREAEDDADAAERSREEDESQRNRDKTQKDDDERDENRRREDLSPEDRKDEDEKKAAVSKKKQERKDRYDKLTPKQKGAYNDRGGFKDDPWALGPDSVSDENKDPLDETTRQYKTFRETLQDIINPAHAIMEGVMKSSYPWYSGKLQAGWYNVKSGKAHVYNVKDRHDGILEYPDIRPVLTNPAAFGLSEKDIKAALKASVEHDREFKGVEDEDEDEDVDDISQEKFNALKGKGPIVNAPLTSMLYKMGWVSIESTKEDMEFVMGTREHLKMAAAVALKHFPVNQRTYLGAALMMRTYGQSMQNARDMKSREEIQKFIGKS